MGTSGVPLDLDKNQIIQALKDTQGKVSYAAKLLKTNHKTLLKYIHADPEIVETMNDLRNEVDDTFLDHAEGNMSSFLNMMDTNIDKAFSSTIYVLNNRGRKRGWVPPAVAAAEESKDEVEKFAQLKLTLAEQQELAELRSWRRASQNGSQAVAMPSQEGSDTPQSNSPTDSA